MLQPAERLLLTAIQLRCNTGFGSLIAVISERKLLLRVLNHQLTIVRDSSASEFGFFILDLKSIRRGAAIRAPCSRSKIKSKDAKTDSL